MKATDEFKLYLNSILNEIDPVIHEGLWDKLKLVIIENELVRSRHIETCAKNRKNRKRKKL